VQATKTVAAWAWLDLPTGVLGNFESNGFWLLPSDGAKEVGVVVKDDGGKEGWQGEVTVRSLWNNTRP
jgi:beta-mannosidase